MAVDLEFATTRREFLRNLGQWGSGSVVVCYLTEGQLEAAERPSISAAKQQMAWLGSDGLPKWRYEGLAKVRGQKIFARDFRAKDLPGWPRQESFVHILRVPVADRKYLGVNTIRTAADLKATKIVTASELTAWAVEASGPYLMPNMMVQAGTAPAYLGQAVALLFFDHYQDYRAAKDKLLDATPYLKLGESGTQPQREAFGISRFVRFQDQSKQEDFSFVKDGPWAPPWQTPDAAGSANARASYYIDRIETDIKTQVVAQQWRLFEASYATQGVDPVFMEPECGLAWFDAKSKHLHLTIGTQSPHDDGVAILNLFRKSTTIKVERVTIHCCYPGGGFGGRDSSDFPLFLALAAVANPGKTQRMIASRFEQFQAGIKRHPAQIKVRLALSNDGKFEALHTHLQLDGGGQNNYSFAVQNVGARNASGGYDFPRSWVDSLANPSIAVPAGSLRGFGSFQSSFALECLIDEAAASMGIDPIDLRLKNIITDLRIMHTGVAPVERIHADVVLQKARLSRLWTERQSEKKQRLARGKRYGVGVALGVKSFGKNPGDACLAGLTIDASGQLHLLSNAVDMGNGSATTLPLALSDILGRPASTIALGETESFAVLALETSKAKDQTDQDRLAANPNWVPSISMSTAASASAFQMRHAVQAAGKALLQLGLWPAAQVLWTGRRQGLAFDAAAIRWVDGKLVYKDLPPLPLPAIAAKAHALGLVTGTLVHSFYRSQWSRAQFRTDFGDYNAEIDALAIRSGNRDFVPIRRQDVVFPPFVTTLAGANRYTPYAVVLAVEVDANTGVATVEAAETFLECGPLINRDLVEGQMHGAFAMGVGQALLESYPLTTDGPGQGDWNLHRYHVPLSKDCALGRVAFNIVTVDHPGLPKGMAEVVFNPIPAAIANAIADATGKRFRQLPIRPEEIKAALL